MKIRKPTAAKIAGYVFGIMLLTFGSLGIVLFIEKEDNSVGLFFSSLFMGIGGFACYRAHTLRKGQEFLKS